MKNSGLPGTIFSNTIKLPIGGFIKQSLIDYPGNISSVIFTIGCNLRCIYCHNPELVLPKKIKETPKLNTNEIFNWLSKNKKLLDAVVISGGEPTIHKLLPEFIKKIKLLELKIKLDTNGTNPDMLQKLIANKLLDYVAMDIKAPLNFTKYKGIAGNPVTKLMIEKVKKSIQIITNSKIDYEFRTTLCEIHTSKDIEEMINSISGKYHLQTVLNSPQLLKNATGAFDKKNLSSLQEKHFDHISLSIRE